MASATATPTIPAGSYATDPAHTTFGFSVKHLGIATVRGKFREFEGTLEIGEDLASARVSGVAKTASIDTGEPQRDEHLRSADFFDAQANPELRFESTSVRAADEENYTIEGNLTMHGITRPITLNAEFLGAEVDPYGNDRVAFEITGKLERSDWEMRFNAALGSGNLMVSDTVKIAIDVSAIRQAD
ncbi:MAG TPA: YceI family protein [Solirubrobacteraceae bacterium]|nr:YceI family protein [Solirubrobacteraceae bacterium]